MTGSGTSSPSAMAWMVCLRGPSGRWPPAAASAAPMYRAATNVNEARKALWDKAFRASRVNGVAPRLL